jgi:hypothetical protein
VPLGVLLEIERLVVAPTMCGDRLPVERSILDAQCGVGAEARMMSATSTGLERRKRLDRFQHVGGTRQDGVFEHGA